MICKSEAEVRTLEFKKGKLGRIMGKLSREIKNGLVGNRVLLKNYRCENLCNNNNSVSK